MTKSEGDMIGWSQHSSSDKGDLIIYIYMYVYICICVYKKIGGCWGPQLSSQTPLNIYSNNACTITVSHALCIASRYLCSMFSSCVDYKGYCLLARYVLNKVM